MLSGALFGGSWVYLTMSLQVGSLPTRGFSCLGCRPIGGGGGLFSLLELTGCEVEVTNPTVEAVVLVARRRPGFTHEAKRCKHIAPHFWGRGQTLVLDWFSSCLQAAGCTHILPTRCPTSCGPFCPGLGDSEGSRAGPPLERYAWVPGRWGSQLLMAWRFQARGKPQLLGIRTHSVSCL